MIVYVWHCPTCDAKGRTNIKPNNELQICNECGDALIIESMIPLYLFD